MKVAYVCHHARPNYEYSWFAAMPVEKIKFITTDNPPADAPTDPKIEYCKVAYNERGWENKFFASTAKRVFYRDFERHLEDVDVVVVLEIFSSLSRQFVEYCRKINKPVVVLVYELIAKHPIYRIPRYKGNAKYCLRHADRFIAVSQAAADHLHSLGADTIKTTVVYPGIDLKVFKPSSKERDDHALIFVGKLGPHKGIDMMLEVYKRIVKDIPDLKLTIVGAGSWKPQVEELAQEKSNVTFLERVPNADLPPVLNKHSIYVLPARETKRFGMLIGAEQFGFSIVEAMACGLATITSDVGALPEIVTDKNVVYPKGDIDALEREIRALLRNPQKIHKMGTYNEKLTRERYDLFKQANRFTSVLDEVISAKKVDK